jgi:hypothetical protein
LEDYDIEQSEEPPTGTGDPGSDKARRN